MKGKIKKEFVNNVRPVHWSNIKKVILLKKKLELVEVNLNKIKPKKGKNLILIN